MYQSFNGFHKGIRECFELFNVINYLKRSENSQISCENYGFVFLKLR